MPLYLKAVPWISLVWLLSQPPDHPIQRQPLKHTAISQVSYYYILSVQPVFLFFSFSSWCFCLCLPSPQNMDITKAGTMPTIYTQSVSLKALSHLESAPGELLLNLQNPCPSQKLAQPSHESDASLGIWDGGGKDWWGERKRVP